MNQNYCNFTPCDGDCKQTTCTNAPVITTYSYPECYGGTCASSVPTIPYSMCFGSDLNQKPKLYLSGDFNINGEKIYLREVMYNDPATIAFWSDGTKTIAKCQGGDEYSKETGLSICILKRLVGSTKVRNIFNEWICDDTNRVTIKDVRKKLKNSSSKDTLTGVAAPTQTTFEDLSEITIDSKSKKPSKKSKR